MLLRSPDAVLAAAPDPSRCAGVKAGLVAVYPPGARDDDVAAEVRAFYSDGRDFAEDPVTGSLNAGLAQWLVPAGHLPEHYVAAQGTVIGRAGRVHVDVVDGTTWVGGADPHRRGRRAGSVTGPRSCGRRGSGRDTRGRVPADPAPRHPPVVRAVVSLSPRRAWSPAP